MTHKRSLFWLAAFLALAMVGTIAMRAQDSSSLSEVLRPPKGANLALVVFEDMECPDCARAAPLIEEASKAYKIPVVRYAFPLPMHDWSFDAAVDAHYFDSKSPALGVAFRAYIFERQQEIDGPTGAGPAGSPEGAAAKKRRLRDFAEKFAREHKTVLPFAVDPLGKFAAEVRREKAVGERVGISHTPTLYVVSNRRQGSPFVEVVDRTKLYNLIDEMKSETE
ncbi:MAG: DsbA family protein [Terriglobales bacterium]